VQFFETITKLSNAKNSVEALIKFKEFKQCKDLLYEHGDRHISPKQSRHGPHFHTGRVGDTPNRTRGSRGSRGSRSSRGSHSSTPLRMEVNDSSSSGGSTINELLGNKEMIALSNRSKLVDGVASLHMTGFRSTQEDSVIVHFDSEQLWVSFLFFCLLIATKNDKHQQWIVSRFKNLTSSPIVLLCTVPVCCF
jgi:hypothetical protein